MKERYVECTGRLFIREVKKHWWSKWKIDKVGPMPIIYLMYQHNQQSIYVPYYCGWATPQKEKEEIIWKSI